jgi:hypothetical protein
VENIASERISAGGAADWVEASMITNSRTEIQLRAAAQWPRARNMPRCSICSDLMVAPEASVLKSKGEVCYLWSCDRCGQGFVTKAHLS